jgi:hypothetical protein
MHYGGVWHKNLIRKGEWKKGQQLMYYTESKMKEFDIIDTWKIFTIVI